VLIDLIQLRVELEPDSASARKQLLEVASSPSAVALAEMELGRVDLDEADARSVREPDRVAVGDPGDGARLGLRRQRLIGVVAAAARQSEHQRRERR
jgi:hypothetical protein